MTEKKSLKEIVLQKAKEGKVVFMTYDGPMEADLDEFIKQPIDGILYDLNRGPEVVLSFIEDPKWVNDYAVGLVIGKLKEQIDELKKDIGCYLSALETKANMLGIAQDENERLLKALKNIK